MQHNQKVLRLPKACQKEMIAQADQAYPHECCGLLIGQPTSTGYQVCYIRPCSNVGVDGITTDRFAIDPGEYMAAEQRARRQGLAVMGVYHSHPDSEPIPSPMDLQEGFPHFVYLIIGPASNQRWVIRSWMLRDDRSAVELVMTD